MSSTLPTSSAGKAHSSSVLEPPIMVIYSSTSSQHSTLKTAVLRAYATVELICWGKLMRAHAAIIMGLYSVKQASNITHQLASHAYLEHNQEEHFKQHPLDPAPP
jgi:hypothetical protein